MSYLDLARDLVKLLESCRLVGYLDSVGKPTNGYGHTGPEVRVGVQITQEIADHDLAVDLATADGCLRACVQPAQFAALPDHQKAALVSFVFNVGAESAWTIWKDIDAGRLDDVPTQLRRFTHGTVDGRLIEIVGLENRREAEIVYWNAADVSLISANGPVPQSPPSGYTRAILTPPKPAPPPPLAKASLINKAVTVLGGAAAAAGTIGSQVHDIVAVHAEEAHIFSALAIGASGVVVAASILGVLIHAYQAQQRAL